MSDPIESRITLPSGLTLAYAEWPAARNDAQTIVLVHATGFHRRCWDAVVERLEGYRVIAMDMRGHGRSENTEVVAWDRFGEDLVGFVDALGIEGAIGAGHSMGGYCMTIAAAERPAAFDRVVLMDPVIMAPELYAARSEGVSGETHPTSKRRNHWRDWQEMFERFEHRVPFSVWDRRVLEDYCRHGITPAEDGEGYVLSCPPYVEASIYVGSAATDIFGHVERVNIPVTVLRARPRDPDRDAMDFSSSPTFEDLAARFPRGRDVHLAKLTHFIPMQDPALAADFILDLR
jgi:pimeloyl-ACP methyl ester carboxylesterase